eukprot:gene24065-10164_t
MCITQLTGPTTPTVCRALAAQNTTELTGPATSTRMSVSFRRAIEHHKQALDNINQFWKTLIESGTPDVRELASSANKITEKRDSGFKEYARLVETDDIRSMFAFSAFLESVMMEPLKGQ